MLDIEVIDDPQTASVALHPMRSRLLAELAEPASAAELATRCGITRQTVNYHLRTLEEHHLVVAAGERKWGGLTERRLVATASTYVVSPKAMGPVEADPKRTADSLSASYLIAMGARMVREVADLWHAARRGGKRLATLSIDTIIRFKSPEDRAAFTQDLTTAVATLAARYHDETSPQGRAHRLIIGAHPVATDSNIPTP